MIYSPNSRAIVARASNQTDTAALANGQLSPEKSARFLQMAFDRTNLMQMVRHEHRTAIKGEIDKIGVGGRLIQAKTEGQAGTERNFLTDKVEYSCVDITLPWSVSEKYLRENIQGQSVNATIARLMANAYGVDIMDLGINGNKSYAGTDDAAFIKIVNGWGTKLKGGSNIVPNEAFGLDIWYDMYNSIKNKHISDKMRWICAPSTAMAWRRFCETKALAGGNTNLYNSSAPCGIEIVPVVKMPATEIWLTDPQNLATVDTFDMVMRQTNEGKDAIQKDERYFAIHGNIDFIVEELAASAIATGITGLTAPFAA